MTCRKRRYLISAILGVSGILLLWTPGHADTWRTVTSGWSIDELVAVGDTVWCGADGGLLMTVASSGEMKLFNRDAGLTGLTVKELAWDSTHARLWLGFSDGSINLFDPLREKVVATISDFSENADVTDLKDIELRNGIAWVLTNIGLSRLEPVSDMTDRWVVRQTYRQLASWTSSVEFTETTVWRNQVFVGSDRGVVRGSLDDDLRNPSAWQFYDWVADLGISPEDAGSTTLLKVVEDTLFLSANTRVWTFNGVSFVRFGSVWGISGVAFFDDDSVAVTRWNGLHLFDSNGQGDILVADPLLFQTQGLVATGNRLWAGTEAGSDGPGGLLIRDPEGWDLVRPNTIGADRIGGIVIAADGDVWLTANRTNLAGVYRLHNGTWTSFTKYNSPSGAFTMNYSLPAIAIDQSGAAWVGSYGDGLHVIARLSAVTDTVVHYDRHNSPLQGYSSNDSDPFLNVLDFAADPSGGLWLANGVPYDGNALLYVPAEWLKENPETRDPYDWIRFGPAEGMNDGRVGTLAVDEQGRVWIGYPREDMWMFSRQPSLMVYDPAGTPTDPSDDSFQKFTWQEISYIADMAFDQEGILWMATPNGLYSLDVQQPLNLLEPVGIAGAVSTFSFSVAVDPLDQIWVATDFGVSVLGRDRYTWVRNYTTDKGPYPSPLVTDQVDAIALNPKTGEAWLGTTQGISIVTTPFRNFADQPQEIVIAPQPLLVGNGGNGPLLFSSTSLSAGAKVRIYTPSGRLIQELSFESAALNGWNGKNSSGDWVASGVYLIVVTGSGGNSITGKVAVIRK
ncbi:MAG: hypothetical protein V2A56_06540 [bacterium]